MWFVPRPKPVPLKCRAEDEIQQAKAAQQDVQRRFLEAVEEGEEIREVVSQMKTRRIRNGYEEMIEDAFLRRPGRRT